MPSDHYLCITGASGFIGKHLLNYSELHDFKVKTLKRRKTVQFSNLRNVENVTGDLSDIESLYYFLEPGSIVINLAYLSSKSKKENLEAIHNLAIACRQVGVARLVHCSTAVVVGRSRDNIITEDTICQPLTEYEKTKLEIENILIEDLKDETEIVIVRPTAVFGGNSKNLVNLANELLGGSRFEMLFKTAIFSKRKMNLVCVENVVEAIYFLTTHKGDISGHYIISDDDVKENNYYDIVRLICKHFDLPRVKIFYLPFQSLLLSVLLKLRRRSNTNPQRIYSSEKLLKLGYKKAVNFQDGIRSFAEWYSDSILKENRNRVS